MMTLRFSPAASITPTDVGVILRSDLGTFQLHGADVRVFVTDVEPLLDGTRDAEAVAAALADYSRSSVLSFLELLRQRGLVEAVSETAAADLRRRPQERFFQTWSPEEADHDAQLRRARVLLVGAEPWGVVAAAELAAAGVGTIHVLDEGSVSAEDLLAVRFWSAADLGRPRREALVSAIERADGDCRVSAAALDFSAGELAVDGGPWDLLIGALSADDRHGASHAARFAQAAGVRSLYGCLDGFEAWVGPGVVPGETGCWNCLRLRRLANARAPKPAHDLDAAQLEARPAPRARAQLAPMAAQTGLLMAMEALKLLTAYTASRLVGRVFVHNLVTNEADYHTVIPMPWCEVCGGAAAILPHGNAPRDASDAPRNGRPLDHLHDVAALRRLFAGWVDEKVGVIHSLTGMTSDVASPPPLTSSAVLANYTEGALPVLPASQVGTGKGLTAVAAHLSAVGEALERYSASRYRLDDLRVASYNQLDGERLDPRRLCLYDKAQYQEPGFPYPRFSASQKIHWVRGRWLDGGPVWVPALLAYFNFQPPPEQYFCQVSSNGLAAGADPDDAALRATMELIERDAAMLTWLCQLPARRVEPDDSLDPRAREVIEHLALHQVKLELYALDVGIGIPTVVCLGLGDGKSWPGATVALSAHTDPRQATVKAIIEQAHVGPYIASLMHSAKIPDSFARVQSLEDHALYYVPVERVTAFDFLRYGGAAIPLRELENGGEPTLAYCAERLERAGVRVAVVDVTSPDVALSPFRVARAVGIDMQPIHFGTHLRRLGNPRLRKLLGRGKLNPAPHPIA